MATTKKLAVKKLVSNVENMMEMFVGTPLEEEGKLPPWYREW